MILKSYDDYKDSESKWLGEIPKHWNVQQLKSVIVNWRNGKWGNDPIENAPDNYVCVRVADFNRTKGLIDDKKLTYRNYKDENISDCLIRPNHILIERSGGGDNQLVGSTVLYRLNYPAVCSNFISILEIDESKVDVDFLQYAFTHLYFLNLNKLAIKQTSGIQNLDLKQYIQNNFALPSKSEQIQVVDFLHKETSRIDTLISKQEQLIQLLDEQRKSIISHAVTKGLNPSAPMKDSGIEWLGEIPAHWDVKPIKSLYSRVKKTGFENETLLSVYREYGVIVKSSRDDNHNKESDDLSPYQLVNVGDLVINKMKAWQGSLAISEHRGIVSPAYYIYEPFESDELNNKFIHNQIRSQYFIQSYKNYSKGIRVGQWDLESDLFVRINLYIPPADEQNEIVDYIQSETNKINNLIDKQKLLIEKLQEYRSSIISHAVTGKIDVREAL